MPKQVRISEEVYQLLLEMQRPRETFSELIGRLQTVAILLTKIEPIIRGQYEFDKWQYEFDKWQYEFDKWQYEKREQEKTAHQ